MSKVNKFRAWYPDEKKMEYQDNKTPDWVGDILTNSYYIPMQWSGLLDMNGVELYEGDIFKFTNLNEETQYYKVFRVKGGLACNTHTDDFDKEHIAFYTALADMQTSSWIEGVCEVIGHIYEEKI